MALTRVAFGSCLHQSRPQPIWSAVAADKPQLMVMLGDNVYGSSPRDELDTLRAAYAAQAVHRDFSEARATLPMLAIWDDHDFGRNDGGGDFALRHDAAEAFLRFWGPLPDRPGDGGLYHVRTFGPVGQRVQIVLLDTRSFRSPLKARTAAFRYGGRYEPDETPGKTMLGDAQWRWLESVLREPADVRVVVSSVQVLADGHGFERWGNLPAERDRLTALLATVPGSLVLVSGDRHYGAFYAEERGGRTLVEMTTSSLNAPIGRPAEDAPIPPLASEIVGAANYGLLEFDWQARRLRLRLGGVDGATLIERTVDF